MCSPAVIKHANISHPQLTLPSENAVRMESKKPVLFIRMGKMAAPFIQIIQHFHHKTDGQVLILNAAMPITARVILLYLEPVVM